MNNNPTNTIQMKTIKNLFIFTTTLLITSCEEVIELDLPFNDPVLVVDGILTNKQEAHTITLRKTSKYNYKYDISSQPFIENATVIINDDIGNIDTLKEVSPGMYITNTDNITGTIGRKYSISIHTPNDGDWLSKPEKMLPVPSIDSIYFDRDPEDISDENPDFYKYSIYVDWQDTGGETNYYLRNISYMWNNIWQTNISWNWVFSDKYFDGKQINKSTLQEDYGGKYFKVRLNQYSLTEDAYRFWNLIHEQTQLSDYAISNSSVPLYGNVYNKDDSTKYALGYFQVSAYHEKSVFIDK
jgi:hypothetical protein